MITKVFINFRIQNMFRIWSLFSRKFMIGGRWVGGYVVSGRWVGGSVLGGSVVGSFNKTALSITNLQIVFIQILIFYHYRMGIPI